MKKRIVDLTGRWLKNLAGEEIPDGQMQRAAANALAVHKHGDPIKIMNMSQDLYRLGVLELDDSDYDILEKAVKDSDGLVTLHKGQILDRLKNSKEINVEEAKKPAAEAPSAIPTKKD